MNITTTAYNSTIGYFVESDLKLPTQLNGLVLSIAPIGAILVNFFVNPRLAAKYDELKNTHRCYRANSSFFICMGI